MATASASFYRLHGLITAIAVAYASLRCDAFSFPRFPLTPPSNHNVRGNRGCNNGANGGGGGKNPGKRPHHFYDGDDNDSGEVIACNLASLLWIGSASDESNLSISDDGDGKEVSSDCKREETGGTLLSVPTENLRGGGGTSTKSKSDSNSSIGSSINDKLDSVQTMLFEPFRLAGSTLSKKLPANPFQKKKEGQSKESNLKHQQELLASTKVQSVSAPDSELITQKDITQCAIESNLIGGTLTPETLELTANKINRLYLEHGYVANIVTGATLVPSSDGKEGDGDGHVELKVREVKLAKPNERNSSPVRIRFVEKVNDADTADDDESVFSLPSQSSDQSQSEYQSFRTVSGRTRPSKIARMVKLVPGSHFAILPQLWSQLAVFPGSNLFGGGGNQRGKSAIFSTIHAVRPVPTSKGDTVELEIIATENKPYVSVEYGVTKSLYSDQWEGELDLKHANVFGGGEVATLTVRKGKGDSGSGRKEDSGLENTKKSATGGPVSWRVSIKDDYFGGSEAGYDLEMFRDCVGVSGNRSSRQRTTVENEEESPDGVNSKEKEDANEDGTPLRTGATMRLRLPHTRYSTFLPKAISAKLERVDPFAKNDSAQCMASMSTDIGPYHHNWKLLSRPIQSTTSATAAAGGRWDAEGKTEDGDTNASTLPYATGTLTSQQIVPLSSEKRSTPSVDFAMRHLVSASSRHLPKHEAILLGMASRIRGYKYNHHQSPVVHQPQKTTQNEKEQKSLLQSLKQLVQGGGADQFRPPIALSKSISGTVEVRIPFERVVREPIFGSGTFVLFGDWCVAEPHLSSSSSTSVEETALLENLSRHSSAGIGLRKVVQGIPLKMDACVTEHGTKGLFFGIGHSFGA